ncbi:MAG: phosphate ABC transporter ATP-binding protein PstB [Chloroflexota bacterium]
MVALAPSDERRIRLTVVPGSLNDRETRISVRNLNVFYGPFHAVRNVTLNIPDCSITAIIGPSGCGKSTVLRCFNRMNDLLPGPCVEGQIVMDDEDIVQTADVVRVRSRIGMVFQRPNPFPKSIFDNVAYGPRMHGTPTGDLKELVERSLRRAALWTEVKDKLNQSALGLSGGQQQRLCIARCLALEPSVVLMDEPCSALDPISTQRIEELMCQLKEQCTIVIVTHNMQQAARVSDITAVFMLGDDRAGELAEIGPTQQVFSAPKDPRTELYVTGRVG